MQAIVTPNIVKVGTGLVVLLIVAASMTHLNETVQAAYRQNQGGGAEPGTSVGKNFSEMQTSTMGTHGLAFGACIGAAVLAVLGGSMWAHHLRTSKM